MSNPTLNFEPSRNLYDNPDKHTPKYTAQPGLTKELVKKISKDKNEPAWMLKLRLDGLNLFQNAPMPKYGPSLKELDLNKIIYYVDPNAKESNTWKEVPEEIRKTFDKLGIPEAEKKALSGVGAQYDSNVVYHNLQKKLKEQGVIFENMDVAVQKYPELVKKYFMTDCIKTSTHKFTMLHAAVWSGGTFIYVPKNKKVELPLQAYFRMNAQKGGQFEHTLIIVDEGAELHYIEGCSSPRYQESSLHAGCVEIFVLENAKMKYSSIENWSKNVFNLNTKRSLVHKNAQMVWVNGNMGSHITMLYPTSVLIGEGASSDSLGIAFAGPGQNQDTGAKAIHLAPNTTSKIHAKSICKGGGITSYRGLIKIDEKAYNSKAFMACNSLILDKESIANADPQMEINNNDVDVAHEATVGRIGDEEVFYLMSRGLSFDESVKMIVSGFIDQVARSLPLEYAVELNKLIELEIDSA